MSKVAWGLDIGHTALKAVKLRGSAARVEIIDFAAVNLEPGDDDTFNLRIRQAMSILTSQKRFRMDPVVISAPYATFLRHLTLPATGRKKIDSIVRYEARQQIPFPIGDVLWDYHVAGEGTQTGETSVCLVAVKQDEVEELLGVIADANLNIDGIQSSPVALYNYIKYDQRPVGTVVALDIGGKVSQLVVLDQTNFWFRPLALSGGDITKALEQKFRIPYDEAEKLKLSIGDSKQGEKIFRVIEPNLRNLAGEIQRTMGYYRSISKGVKFEHVYLIGRGARLPNLVKYLEETLGLGVRQLEAPLTVQVAPSVSYDLLSADFQGLGVAIGLGLQGIGAADLTVNLLPERIARRKLWGKKKAAVLVALGAMVVAAITGNLATKGMARDLDRVHGTIGQKKEWIGGEETRVKGVEKGIPALAKKVDEIASVARDRKLCAAVLYKVAMLRKDFLVGEIPEGTLSAMGLEPHNKAFPVAVHIVRIEIGRSRGGESEGYGRSYEGSGGKASPFSVRIEGQIENCDSFALATKLGESLRSAPEFAGVEVRELARGRVGRSTESLKEAVARMRGEEEKPVAPPTRAETPRDMRARPAAAPPARRDPVEDVQLRGFLVEFAYVVGEGAGKPK